MFKMVFKTGDPDKIKNITCNSFVFPQLLVVILKLPYWVLQNYLQKGNLINT